MIIQVKKGQKNWWVGNSILKETENDDSRQEGQEKLVGRKFYDMNLFAIPVTDEDGENYEDGNLGEELNKPADPENDENTNRK